MSMIIAGERNNDLGSVGVAPNSFIIPYNFGYDTFKTEKAIRNIIKNKDDIINMSNSVQIDFWVYIVAYINGISSVENAIKDSISSNIPVIVAGNNNGSYSDKFGYANLTAVSGVIAVGGVDIIPRNNDGTLVLSKYPDYTATFIKNKSYSENGKGSGFGDDYVWAPWQYYSVLDVDNNKNVLLIKEGGTSGAAAFTSGVVALMKSRNKNLTPSDIEDILHKTSDQLVKPHEDMTKFGDQKLINAKKAVEEAIERKIKDDKKFSLFDYEAKDLGIVQFNLTKTLSNVKENNNIIGTIKFNDDTSQNVLRTASDYELGNSNNNYVRFFGWEPNITGLKDGLEVLNMKKEIIPDPHIDPIEVNGSKNNTIKNGSEIKITGENLYSFDKDIQIIFKDTTVTPKVDYYYNLSSNSVTRNKNATLLVFTVDFNKIKNSSGQSIQDKLNGFSSIKVDVAFKGISNKISNFVSFDANKSFFISSLPSTISYNNQQIPVIENGATTQVHKGDTVAVTINPAWRDIEWVVDSSKSVKLSQIVDQYAITKIPPDLPTNYQAILMQFVLSGTKQYVSYEKALEILAYPETLSYQGSNIPVVATGTNTMVTSGSKIALPMTDALIQRLQNFKFNDGYGNSLTYYELVNNYAILGIPPTLSPSVRDIFIENISTGKVELTYEQALYKAALAMNLNPVIPTDAITLPDSDEFPPLIYDNTSLSVHPGDIVAAALYGLSKNDNVTVTVNGQNMPIYDQRDNYISFRIAGNLLGVQSAVIKNQNGEVVYNNSLNIQSTPPVSNSQYSVLYKDQSGVSGKIYPDPNSDLIYNALNLESYTIPIALGKGSKILVDANNYEKPYKFYLRNSDNTNEVGMILKESFPYFETPDLFTSYGTVYSSSNIFSSDATKVVGTNYDSENGITNVAIYSNNQVTYPINPNEYISSIHQYSLRFSNDDNYISFIRSYYDENDYSYHTKLSRVKATGVNNPIEDLADFYSINAYEWSKDSKKIIVSVEDEYSNDMLYSLDVSTKQIRDITPYGIEQVHYMSTYYGWFPTWLNENTVLFTGRASDGSDDYTYQYGAADGAAVGSALYKVNVNSGLVEKVIKTQATDYYYSEYYLPMVSPDGKYVAFHAYIDCSPRLFFIDLATLKRTALGYGVSGGWLK